MSNTDGAWLGVVVMSVEAEVEQNSEHVLVLMSAMKQIVSLSSSDFETMAN